MSNLLPSNSTPQEEALAETVARVGDVGAPLRKLWDPDQCPANLLPWLAWALSVDFWQADWPEQVKRDQIAGALEIHRHKGTPWAVERSLELAGIPFARVSEWFEYGGSPSYFKIVVDIEGETVSAEDEARLLHYIDLAKNVRSKLDGPVEYNLATRSAVPLYALGVQASEVLTVYPQ